MIVWKLLTWQQYEVGSSSLDQRHSWHQTWNSRVILTLTCMEHSNGKGQIYRIHICIQEKYAKWIGKKSKVNRGQYIAEWVVMAYLLRNMYCPFHWPLHSNQCDNITDEELCSFSLLNIWTFPQCFNVAYLCWSAITIGMRVYTAVSLSVVMAHKSKGLWTTFYLTKYTLYTTPLPCLTGYVKSLDVMMDGEKDWNTTLGCVVQD